MKLNKMVSILMLSMLIFPTQLFSVGGQESGSETEALRVAEEETTQIPSRIVLAGRAVFMLAGVLYSFPGTGDRIVGLSNPDQGMGNFFSLMDPGITEKHIWGTDVGVEEVLGANPDLVVLKSFMKESLGDPLEVLGVRVVYLTLETPEQYWHDLAVVGDILGQPERAAEIIDFLKKEIEAVEVRHSGEAKPDVLVINHSTRGGESSFRVPSAGWIQTTMTNLAGGDPVWLDGATKPGWSRVGLEQIAAWNPEVVFVISYTSPAVEVVEQIVASPAWQGIEAVGSGRVYPMLGDYHSWGQPDIRWVLGTWWMADRIGRTTDPSGSIHPPAEALARAREVYGFLYPLDAERMEAVMASIR